MDNSELSPNNRYYEIVIRKVPITISDEDILKQVKAQYPSAISCRRIIARNSTQPTSLIRTRFTQQAHKEHCLNNGINVAGRHRTVEKVRLSPYLIRCYNCQGLGHIASLCSNETRCQRCAENHDSRTCNLPAFPHCVNCGGDHQTSDPECPKWKAFVREQKLTRTPATQMDICSMKEVISKLQQSFDAQQKQYSETMLNIQQQNRENRTVLNVILSKLNQTTPTPTASEPKGAKHFTPYQRVNRSAVPTGGKGTKRPHTSISEHRIEVLREDQDYCDTMDTTETSIDIPGISTPEPSPLKPIPSCDIPEHRLSTESNQSLSLTLPEPIDPLPELSSSGQNSYDVTEPQITISKPEPDRETSDDETNNSYNGYDEYSNPEPHLIQYKQFLDDHPDLKSVLNAMPDVALTRIHNHNIDGLCIQCNYNKPGCNLLRQLFPRPRPYRLREPDNDDEYNYPNPFLTASHRQTAKDYALFYYYIYPEEEKPDYIRSMNTPSKKWIRNYAKKHPEFAPPENKLPDYKTKSGKSKK